MSNNALRGACIVGQSGGPTAVINSSVLGVIQAAFACDFITNVYGAEYGIRGVIDDSLFDLGAESKEELDLLRNTPAAALGSCRYKMKDSEADESDYIRILETFKKHDVRYFFYIGGNDSMDTCNKISKYMQKAGYECRIIGIPKTIDNDLTCTDFCPGFPSAAKYIATTLMEIYRDGAVYDRGSITIVEIMGRNAGWLTAAAALAQHFGAGPDLIYMPELVFDTNKFLSDVYDIFDRKHNVLVAVSEGVMDKDGVYISEYGSAGADKDAFGHVQMGGLAATLAYMAKQNSSAKIRGIELSLLQRCANHLASAVDSDMAYEVGKAAVTATSEGITDKMVGIERGADGNSFHTKLCELSDVANSEKKVPLEWISASGTGIEQPFLDYALPLIQGEKPFITEDGLPRHARLKKVKV